MEINEATIDIFLFARWFGFAPYTVIRNSKDQIIDFKLSRPLCFYGLISYAILYLTGIFPFLRNVYFRQPLTYATTIFLYILWTIKCIFILQTKNYSFFSRLAYVFDVNTAATPLLVNVFCGVIALENTRRVNQLLAKVREFQIHLRK